MPSPRVGFAAISGNGQIARQRWRGSDNFEKCSGIAEDGPMARKIRNQLSSLRIKGQPSRYIVDPR